MIQDHMGQGVTVVGREVPQSTLPFHEGELHSPNNVLIGALGIEIGCVQLAPTKHGRWTMLIDDVSLLLQEVAEIFDLLADRGYRHLPKVLFALVADSYGLIYEPEVLPHRP
jgi:hypothetical protein